jgi:hypothetical protein
MTTMCYVMCVLPFLVVVLVVVMVGLTGITNDERHGQCAQCYGHPHIIYFIVPITIAPHNDSSCVHKKCIPMRGDPSIFETSYVRLKEGEPVSASVILLL